VLSKNWIGIAISATDETVSIPEKYKVHKEALISLFRNYKIDGVKSLIGTYIKMTHPLKGWA
jgi:hypothetical protein